MNKYLKEAKRIFEENDYTIPENAKVYAQLTSYLAAPFRRIKIDKVLAIDMKGLMYGSVVANKLKVGFVPILKGNKIKNRKLVVKSKNFVDYSGKEKSVEIFTKSVKGGDRVLLVDDWFESGNTGKSAIKLIESLGGKVVGISLIFNQLKEEDEAYFSKYNFHYLIRLEPKKLR